MHCTDLHDHTGGSEIGHLPVHQRSKVSNVSKECPWAPALGSEETLMTLCGVWGQRTGKGERESGGKGRAIWNGEHTPTPSNDLEIGSFPWVHHTIDHFLL